MKNIVVVGGGTAGWLTALVINKFWKNTSVTLIESSKIGILGAGEGGTANFGHMLSLLDIDINEFYHETGSTYKEGLNLTNWTYLGSSYKHPFIHENGQPTNFNRKRTAFHFDAKKVSEYFKKISLNRDVKWIDGEVDFFKNNKTDITGVVLKNGIEINDIDFIFDCSGFARLITGNFHKEEWVDYSKYLLLNKAFGFFLPQTKKITKEDTTCTNMIAMSSGWMFQIPLQHRIGCGYSFNDKYITLEEAKKEIENYLNHEIKIQKVFNFDAGRFKRSWIGNSISIGLSYGFLEPLEATSLMSTIMQLKRLIDVDFNPEYRDSFNIWCDEINEQNMMFVRYHYLNEKKDTDFWKDSYNMPIPEKLKKILDENNKVILEKDVDLLSAFDLKETKEIELTFKINNYNTIFIKNNKIYLKELI